jgi:hypothetical protein
VEAVVIEGARAREAAGEIKMAEEGSRARVLTQGKHWRIRNTLMASASGFGISDRWLKAVINLRYSYFVEAGETGHVGLEIL